MRNVLAGQQVQERMGRQSSSAGTHLVLLLAATLSGCGGRVSSATGAADWGEPIAVPLTPASLVEDTFLVVTDLWASMGPGPDTLLFHPDGSITNRRAGLSGPWLLLSDTTVRIGTRVFRWRRQTGDFFAPLRPDSAGVAGPGWRIRRGEH
jgi:hypothetical protein